MKTQRQKKTYTGNVIYGWNYSPIRFDTLPHTSNSVILKTFVIEEYDKKRNSYYKKIESSLPIKYYVDDADTGSIIDTLLQEGDTLKIGIHEIFSSVYCCNYKMFIVKHALPVVSTGTISGITISSATIESTLNNMGSRKITAHGHIWNTDDTNLTLTGNKVTINNLGKKTTTGNFISKIHGLSENTTYYTRAYANNTIGITYGEIKSFKTLKSNPNPSPSKNLYLTIPLFHNNCIYLHRYLFIIKFY